MNQRHVFQEVRARPCFEAVPDTRTRYRPGLEALRVGRLRSGSGARRVDFQRTRSNDVKLEAMFRPLADMERSLSDLYERFSETFAPDPELAFVFFKMSAEEKGHASLVEYQRRLVQKNQELSADVDGDLTLVHETIEQIRALRDSIGTIDAGDAIRETLAIEKSVAESHYRNALRQARPELARLLNSLGGEDSLHISRLEDLAASRGIDVPV
jgi:hypothetical protein